MTDISQEPVTLIHHIGACFATNPYIYIRSKTCTSLSQNVATVPSNVLSEKILTDKMVCHVM